MSVWRNVQVERPSSSTSGGQEEEGFGGLVVVVVGEFVEEALVVDFIMLFHAAPEVQVRHLFFFSFISLFSFVYLHSFKHDPYLFGEWGFFSF